jgi:type 1 glutamine amidotransferase
LDDTKSGGSGKPEPVLVVSTAGKGRIVGVGLGYDSSAMHEPEFRAIIARASEWAATGTVTLPGKIGVEEPTRDHVKTLLITGGHDHEAAFYEVLSAHKDLGSIPILTSATAFKTDLRGKYDVIVMYDFTRDLDDAGKQNLRAFVESGGGVVVLHHALLNYQTWDWWIDEVVGGSYRLSRAGKLPSSSVKDNQQIYVTPAPSHPIISGIEPFHIQDEAYKNLRMSPRIKPLLTTDNPTSDTNLAWVGPGDHYRVVAIQLGHGHTAFGHPAYRALVHNAILWAGGKIK